MTSEVWASILGRDLDELDYPYLKRIGVAGLHFDVMEEEFVGNTSFTAKDLDFVLGKGLPLDVHLMVKKPLDWVDDFLVDGVEWVSAHAESLRTTPVLQKIIDSKKKAGLALNPRTHAGIIKLYNDITDFVLVMGVQPGKGGQAFQPEVLSKITELAGDYGKLVSVDGGVNGETGPQCAKAGAQKLCVGSYLFNNLKWDDEEADRKLIDLIIDLSRE